MPQVLGKCYKIETTLANTDSINEWKTESQNTKQPFSRDNFHYYYFFKYFLVQIASLFPTAYNAAIRPTSPIATADPNLHAACVFAVPANVAMVVEGILLV